ncbi:lysm domain receptor-like kinase 3 [Quercus suber]|uniref:Lysm domain receptor-like kinase 3 n=1 Tax=Quercus suber TaxID=58331 RepID=A0AAW0KMD4_QUESU
MEHFHRYVAGASILAFFLYERVYRRKKKKNEVVETSTLPAVSQHQYLLYKIPKESLRIGFFYWCSFVRAHITMDKSVEFSYEELAKATDDFSLNNKLGQGGFGSVYYAELRGEVRLIGYCVEGSLFLVYEYIENGNLSQHLHSSRRDPLPWSTRVNIALDSARGLEYIHEYTVPVYIHRDIKSANILIDEKFRGKVADFGLTKLTEYGTASLNSSLAGTFGYMSPEYTQYGKISPKIDVYAFGVVLFELISGMEAVGLVALFKNVLSGPDPGEYLHTLVDPRLEKSCSSPSNVWKRKLMKPHVNWRCMA